MTTAELQDKVEELVWEAFRLGMRCGDPRCSEREVEQEREELRHELRHVQYLLTFPR